MKTKHSLKLYYSKQFTPKTKGSSILKIIQPIICVVPVALVEKQDFAITAAS